MKISSFCTLTVCERDVYLLINYFKSVDKQSLFGEALQTQTGVVSSAQVCVARELKASM